MKSWQGGQPHPHLGPRSLIHPLEEAVLLLTAGHMCGTGGPGWAPSFCTVRVTAPRATQAGRKKRCQRLPDLLTRAQESPGAPWGVPGGRLEVWTLEEGGSPRVATVSPQKEAAPPPLHQ